MSSYLKLLFLFVIATFFCNPGFSQSIKDSQNNRETRAQRTSWNGKSPRDPDKYVYDAPILLHDVGQPELELGYVAMMNLKLNDLYRRKHRIIRARKKGWDKIKASELAPLVAYKMSVPESLVVYPKGPGIVYDFGYGSVRNKVTTICVLSKETVDGFVYLACSRATLPRVSIAVGPSSITVQ